MAACVCEACNREQVDLSFRYSLIQCYTYTLASFQGLPHFHLHNNTPETNLVFPSSSTPMYYCECKQKVNTGRPGNKATYIHTQSNLGLIYWAVFSYWMLPLWWWGWLRFCTQQIHISREINNQWSKMKQKQCSIYMYVSTTYEQKNQENQYWPLWIEHFNCHW